MGRWWCPCRTSRQPRAACANQDCMARRSLHAPSCAALRANPSPRPPAAQNVLAKMVIERVPSVEMVRFVNSGTEACLSVVRLMRAYTGREKVRRCPARGAGQRVLPTVRQGGCNQAAVHSQQCFCKLPRSGLFCLQCLQLVHLCSSGLTYIAAPISLPNSPPPALADHQVHRLLPRPRRPVPGAGRLWCADPGPV